MNMPGWGSAIYPEPALKVSYPDGNRDLVLRYVSHKIDGDALHVELKDIDRELFVHLLYTIDPKTGIIGRSAVIENRTKTPVMIEAAAAATWNLPRGTELQRALSGGTLGGGKPVAEAAGAARRAGARKQARVDWAPEQSVVRDRAWRASRRRVR